MEQKPVSIPKKKILIADDDRDFRVNLAEFLRREGFTISQAGTGEEAVATLAKEKHDVLLLDMVMPGMAGIAAIGKIRETNKTIKIILVTAFATVDTAVEAMKKGADDYIQKPFRTDELLAIIRRALEEARFELDIKHLNLDFTLSSLANPIRRRTIQLIGSGEANRLMEIANKLAAPDHTKVLFHLKKLKESEIIAQREDKSYELTQSGQLMHEFLRILAQHISVFTG
ncbi:MAG: response regulator [Magnetococcales bacterium]|nr:response regulator [Magnetococcales bacterium]